MTVQPTKGKASTDSTAMTMHPESLSHAERNSFVRSTAIVPFIDKKICQCDRSVCSNSTSSMRPPPQPPRWTR
jgi:hypothetical protein